MYYSESESDNAEDANTTDFENVNDEEIQKDIQKKCQNWQIYEPRYSILH